MTLTLRAVSLNEQPLTQPITAVFDAKGGTIGRADNNLMALPDPERHISRQQAQISQAGSIYRIKNIGSANPIHVRGQALGQGESAPLAHRDQVRIGGYLLEVSEDHEDDSAAHTILRGRAAVDARTGGGAAGPAQPLTPRGLPAGAPASAASAVGLVDKAVPISSSNPFAGMLGPATPSPLSAPPPAPAPAPPARAAVPLARVSAPPHAPAAPPLPPSDNPFADLIPSPAGIPPAAPAFAAAAATPARLPDDFDPFAPPPPPPAPSPRASPPPMRARAGDFDDLIPPAEAQSIDDLFGLKPAARDPLADFMADVKPASGGGEPLGSARISTDPLALFGDAPAAPPMVPTLPDHTPALRAAFTPPSLAAAREEPAAAPPRAAASVPGDVAALWQAFCAGAGIRPESQAGPTPELMQVAGALLRAAIDGSLQLMAVRAATKHEMRAQVTVIQARNNNPLKFSPDVQSALEQLLQPPLRGFLDGPAAMTDAMHDLVGHSIGTMAGMRAALEGVLDRFAPQALEAKLSGKTVLDALLPMNRKAKLWELYLQHAQGIRGEAQDDFETLFSKAFLTAYEQQVERLQAATPPAEPRC